MVKGDKAIITRRATAGEMPTAIGWLPNMDVLVGRCVVIGDSYKSTNPHSAKAYFVSLAGSVDSYIVPVAVLSNLPVGTKIRVVANTSGHTYAIGATLTIDTVLASNSPSSYYHVREGKTFLWGADFEVIRVNVNDLTKMVDISDSPGEEGILQPGTKIKVVGNTCSHGFLVGNVLTIKKYHGRRRDHMSYNVHEGGGYITSQDFELFRPDVKLIPSGTNIRIVEDSCCHGYRRGDTLTIEKFYGQVSIPGGPKDAYTVLEGPSYVVRDDFEIILKSKTTNQNTGGSEEMKSNTTHTISDVVTEVYEKTADAVLVNKHFCTEIPNNFFGLQVLKTNKAAFLAEAKKREEEITKKQQ